MSTLLFEIGTEELPAGYIEPALVQLREGFAARAAELKIAHDRIETLATPRRLALIVHGLADKQDDIVEEIMGPSTKAGLAEDGSPTKAAIGFARSKGADPGDLEVVPTPKGDYLMLVREVKGKAVQELLADMLLGLLTGIGFPKSMRWGSNRTAFARPIQWLLALNDEAIIPFELEGIRTGKSSRGHRFLNNHEIAIEAAADYEASLARVNVVADPEKRREAAIASIRKAVAGSGALSAGEPAIDEGLLATVTNLVEMPCAVCGQFDEKFLQLPEEVLITSMREHQKYFPVVNDEGGLLAGFVALNNTRVEDEELTRKGHQRVLRARLEDALFFFNSDKQKPFERFAEGLQGIVFQAKLGTMEEKTARLVKLTRILAEKLAPEAVADSCRAAELCKVDLLTDMVVEFPSLQGVMGEVYARLSGEKEEVALALKEHYMPRRSGAELPRAREGALVGLADRIDTISGCFGIGQIPSGTADPFGLRRISLAILQIIEAFNFRLSLREVIHKALSLYGDRVDGGSATVDKVIAFIEARFRNDRVAKGDDPEAVAAGVAAGFDDIRDCTMRIAALASLKSDPSFAVLASSYKRIRNIIKDNQETGVEDALLREEAEKDLYRLLVEVRGRMQPLLGEQRYEEALKTLLEMKEPVDRFFDEVMVMAEDETVRQNRLNLLTALGELVLRIGDISKMQEQ